MPTQLPAAAVHLSREHCHINNPLVWKWSKC
jgi:hypothetical protein